VVKKTDIRSTLDTALSFFLNSAQVVVDKRQDTTGVAIKNEVTEVHALLYPKGRLYFLDDFDIMNSTIYQNHPPNSISLLLVVNRDRTGQFLRL